MRLGGYERTTAEGDEGQQPGVSWQEGEEEYMESLMQQGEGLTEEEFYRRKGSEKFYFDRNRGFVAKPETKKCKGGERAAGINGDVGADGSVVGCSSGDAAAGRGEGEHVQVFLVSATLTKNVQKLADFCLRKESRKLVGFQHQQERAQLGQQQEGQERKKQQGQNGKQNHQEDEFTASMAAATAGMLRGGGGGDGQKEAAEEGGTAGDSGSSGGGKLLKPTLNLT